MKNLYALLGVDKTADDETLKKAYRKLAQELHPDRTGGDKVKTERFKEVCAAYAILSNHEKRRQYDATEQVDPSGRRGTRDSIFGPYFEELVGKVQTEGITLTNFTSILRGIVDVSTDIQQNAAGRVQAATSKPNSLLDLVDDMFGVAHSLSGKKKTGR